MATEYEDLVETLIFLITRRLESKREFTRGLLGDGLGNVDVPGREGYSYVRPDRSSNKILEIFNKRVFSADGTPVLIGEIPWQPGLSQCLDIDWDTYLTVGWPNRFAGIAQHGDTHVWRDGFIGEDPFSVYRRQIFDLRTEPIGSGTTSVIVTPYGLNDAGTLKTWPGSPGIDLAPAIPGATGTVRNALVYWDYSGETLYGTLGVATGTLDTVTETSIPPKPVEPVGSIPSAYVQLQGGQAQITESDIKDARPIFSTPTPGNDGIKVSKVWRSNFGSVALSADANGNIGIGTISPDYTLELSGATAPKLAASDTGLAHGITTWAQTDTFFLVEEITDNDGGARVWGLSDTAGQTPLRFLGAFGSTNPTDTVAAIDIVGAKRSGTGLTALADAETVFGIGNNSVAYDFTVLGNGNVGIGTVAPLVKLEVGDANPTYGAVEPANAVSLLMGGDSFGRLYIEGSTQADILLDDSGGAANEQLFQMVNVGGVFKWRVLNDVATVRFDNVVAVDNATGNVGIGVSPVTNLHIEGVGTQTVRIKNTTHGAGDHGYIHFVGEDGPGNTYNSSRIIDLGPGSGRIGQLQFQTGFANVLTTIMTLTAISGGGNVGIGTTSPQGNLHSYDAISGWLLWEYDGLDGTVRTVIPNGTGDVLYIAQIDWVMRTSGGTQSSSGSAVPGGSLGAIFGGVTVTINVNADGSVTISRTAGVVTVKVALTLRWI